MSGSISRRLNPRARFVVAALIPLGMTASADVHWRNDAVPVAQAPDSATALAAAVTAGEQHMLIRFFRMVTPAERAQIAQAGLTLQTWLGDNSFFADVHAPPGRPISLTDIPALQSVERIQTAWKMHPMFSRYERPEWAIVPPPADAPKPLEPWVAVYVMCHPSVAFDDARAAVLQFGGWIASELPPINGLVLEMPLSRVEEMAAHDAVLWVEPALPPMTETNDSNRAITQANIVQVAPYNLNGAGVTVMVYDGGTGYSSHVDFQGRLSVRDASGLITHATHVAGTIGGAGIGNPLYRGMAPGVLIESYGYEQVGGLHQGFLYTDPGDFLADYTDAIQNRGADIANNSIGTNTAANGFPCSWEGDYGVMSNLIDAVVAGSLGSPFRIVWANGNERSTGRCGATYHTTAPPACAKNHITVGAMNSNDDSVTYFTSWGPTDDGRLKPDISAPGCQVGADGGVTSCSTSGTSSYTTYCGTSMASPTVCGLSALILQDFRAHYPTQPDPRNSTLKVLLAHNAQDLVTPGPDFQTGYGSVRIQRTIDFLRSGQFFEDQVGQGGVVRLTVAVPPGEPELKVTLAWDDAPAAPNVVGTIVNDLDIVALDPSGTRHYPWTLDGLGNPAAPAVRTQADHVNNLEQVYVQNPAAGVWTIEIRGFNVPQGPQVFSACITPASVGDCNGNGIDDLQDIANGTSQDCNLNSIPDECESATDCNHNGIRDFCDIFSGASLDRNANQIPDECEPDCNTNGSPDDWDISTGLSQDCNANLQPDECDIAGAVSQDCDVNGVPDECDPDCNGNGTPDTCDIAGGSSIDCNNNGIPDECETDCNGNGIADECDIASGFSQDANHDGYPDECSVAYVNWAASGNNTGYDWSDAFLSLDDAVDYALQHQDVRQIWIAAGDYAPTDSNGFAIRSGLTVYGGFAGGETSIDERDWITNVTYLHGDQGGTAQHVVRLTNYAAGTALDGVIILGGTASNGGGGVLITGGAPTIRNCWIAQNYSQSSGGGVLVSAANAAFLDCVFYLNAAFAGDGGAIYSSGAGSLTLTRCWFALNEAFESSPAIGRGGAIFNGAGSLLTIADCIFDSNFATNSSALLTTQGGAIANLAAGARIDRTQFYSSQANLGGAIYSSAAMTLVNCIITGNVANDPADNDNISVGLGGGIYGATGASITVKSCTIAGNWATNKAAGAQMNGAFQNCIVYHNVVPPQPAGEDPVSTVEAQYRGTVSIRYSDVAGLLTGIPGQDPPNPANYPGCFEDAPMFVLDPVVYDDGTFEFGDLHLLPGSRCIDAGENVSVPSGVTIDLDGAPRFVDDPDTVDHGAGAAPIVDMGTYEFQVAVACPGDLNGDGTVDLSDLTALLAHFGTQSGGTLADGDVDGDGDVDLADLTFLLGQFGQTCR